MLWNKNYCKLIKEKWHQEAANPKYNLKEKKYKQLKNLHFPFV